MCFVVVCVCACVLLVGNARFYDKFVLKFLYFSLEINCLGLHIEFTSTLPTPFGTNLTFLIIPRVHVNVTI